MAPKPYAPKQRKPSASKQRSNLKRMLDRNARISEALLAEEQARREQELAEEQARRAQEEQERVREEARQRTPPDMWAEHLEHFINSEHILVRNLDTSNKLKAQWTYWCPQGHYATEFQPYHWHHADVEEGPCVSVALKAVFR